MRRALPWCVLFVSMFGAACDCGGGTARKGGDGGADGATPECAAVADCTNAHGAPPCGSWQCNGGLCQVSCPGCADADGDGYGSGAPGACAGPDCDDADRNLGSDGMRACYAGPAGTAGVGACRAGVQLCVAGTLGGCSGAVVPGGEACNALDDDCDGQVDESLGTFTCGVGACTATANACATGTIGTCTPGVGAANDAVCDGIDGDCDGLVDEDCTCIHVAPSGNDAMAASMPLNAVPFLTVQAAIAYASANASAPRNVCVAGGNACTNNATYTGALAMANGVSVYGRYEATTWTRCAQLNTTLATGVATGVSFASTVTSATVLAGFKITRASAASTTGITIDGAKGVTITDVVIDETNTVGSANAYGIVLVNAADATIAQSSIMAGTGSVESIGIRSVGSRPTIRGNCGAFDAAGHCTAFCGASPNKAIRGRFTNSGGTGTTYAILLDDSPGALVDGNAICGNDGDVGAGIRVVGDATGTILRTNLVNAWGGAVDSHGIWLEDCAGAAPWIVDNQLIASAGDSTTTRTDGVRAVGDCHPVIDSNVHITGGGEGGSSGANGVHCDANASSVPSRCAVLGNLLIDGSTTQFPPTSVGVRCDHGSCLRIEDNVITGRGGQLSAGLWIDASGTFVSRNVVSGGCASGVAIGIHADGAFARIENNFIHGFDAATCPAGSGATAMTSIGLHVVPRAGANELDVHSNTIEAHARPGATCTAIGISFDLATGVPALPPQGVFRNDVVRVSDCSTRFDVREEGAAADPRIVEHVVLDPSNAPTALYVDEGTTNLTTIAQVDALTDATFAGNLSFDPAFVAYPTDLHVTAASMCLGAGTSTGAPSTDYDRDPRSATAPAIGADER